LQQEIIFKSTTIAYQKIGEGQPVVLIHGFGEDATIWDSLINHIKNNFLCINIHLPGCGSSAINLGVSGSIVLLAEMVGAIFDREQIVKATILGHSMGGYIALAFAKKNEHRLNGMGLLHSTVFEDDETKKIARQKNIDFIAQHGAELFLQQTIPNLFAPNFVNMHRNVVEAQIAKTSYISSDTLMAYTYAMQNRESSRDFIEKTDLPILYVVGKQDNAVPFESSIQQYHLPKISYIHVLNEVGHMGMIEAEAKFNQLVKNYLSDIKK
jgi:pimeloyl-ACP methyl ester carboxylesterase